MAVTGVMTVRDLVTDALRKINVCPIGDVPEADDADVAMRALNTMLKGWQNKGYLLWTYTTGSIPVTTGNVHTLDPVRPVRINTVNFKRPSGIELPMQRLTREEYEDLPLKTSTGIPTCFYYDRQREAARLIVWPIMAAVDGETLEYTYEREFEDVDDLDNELDLPAEWWEACVYGLGARLADDFERNVPNVIGRAEILLSEALAADREGSVFWGSEC